jgi:hypothetical protein
MEGSSSMYIKQVGVKDETFHPSNAGHYILHINVDGFSGFSFSVYDAPRNKFIVLEAYTPRKKCTDNQEFVSFLKAVLRQLPELTKNKFKEVHMSFSHAASTFVPSALYVEEDKEKYFLMNHTLHPDEKIMADYIGSLDAYTIYALDNSLSDYFKGLFSGIHFHHVSTILVQNILIENKNRQSASLFAHVKPDHFELLMLKDHKLIFYNRFSYKTAEDFIYYILFVCEQLQLNPENAEIQLLGEIEKKSAVYAILYKYIRNIKFGKRSEAYGYSYGFNDIPAHYYYSLMTQVFAS